MTWQSDTERTVREAVFGTLAVTLAATVWLMCAVRDVRDEWRRRRER